MSSNVKLADDYVTIAQRLKEIEAERWRRLQETKLPDDGPAPDLRDDSDLFVDWS